MLYGMLVVVANLKYFICSWTWDGSSWSFFSTLLNVPVQTIALVKLQVLMQTGDAQLEMRGRCSAGQKVNSNWHD